MSNKEMAVQLYSAILQAAATIATSPNFHGSANMPTPEEAVERVAELTDLLSRVEDK